MQKVRIPEAGRTARGAVAGFVGRLGMLRWVLAALLLALLAFAAYLAFDRLIAPKAPVVALQTFKVRRGTIQSTVNSTGTVVPLAQARLAFRASGRVAEVGVKPGDAVTKGQALAKLDTTDLALQVSQAKAQLSTAEAKLASVKAGSRAEEVKAAQAQLDAAKAKLDLMLAGGRAEEVAAAKAGVDSAKAKLNQLMNSPLEVDVKAAEQGVAAAQAALQKAQADLAKLKSGPTAEDLKGADLAVEQAKVSLWSQQINRDGVCGNPRNAQYQCDAANASVAAAETALNIALNNQAKLKAPPRPEDVAAAEQAVASAQAQLASAQAKLKQVKAGPTPDDLAVAQAAVVQAEQTLALKQKPYTDADILAQRQAVAQAEAQLAAKQVPYTDADVQQAQAGVDQARAQLELAQYNLANAVLVAPFDGVVNSVTVNVGEVSSSGSTIVLVNPKDLRLDVSVDEADIARIEVGQKTVVTFDAVPGQTFSGKVVAVAPSATLQSGVATYLVSISIADPGPVKPGMTGNASIVYGEQANALVVPNRAIRTQGRSRVVEVLVDGQRESRQVKVGVSNDQMSEITEGLAEGDEVIIPSTTSAIPRMGPSQPQPVIVPKPGR